MRKELEQRLLERWPRWFNTEGDFRLTAMPRGFEHDDGWFDILWRLCEDLEPLVAEFEQESGTQFEVLQVKEKFGGLRFYVNCRRNEAIRQRIGIAAQTSPFALARFAVNREHCGKHGGSRPCATSITLATREQEKLAELTHEQLWYVCQQFIISVLQDVTFVS